MSATRTIALSLLALLLGLMAAGIVRAEPLRGTGDLGIVIERASGSVVIIDTTTKSILGRVEGLGDLSHASAVYSRDERYVYIFGRDGGLTKIDMLTRKIVKRVMQSGNSIGGAISQDGKLVAVSNYTPGGVKVFDSGTLDQVADIPTGSKTVGLVDAPDEKFVFSLYDKDAIWMADMTDPKAPKVTKYDHVGHQPYDGLITPDGRTYIAGLFGEDAMAKLDLWAPKDGVKHILSGYGKGDRRLPVYKMPHLEGWTVAGRYAFVPAVGHHEVLVIDTETWKEVDSIPVYGQPVFVMARPDDHQIWVNFAVPRNEKVQVIDVPTRKVIKTLTPGKGVLHMAFTPRGENVWISVRDTDTVQIYDTRTFKLLKELHVKKPSGIFFTDRANKIGL